MLPAPTTMSPDKSASFTATRRFLSERCRCSPVNAGSKGSRPRPARSLAAMPSSRLSDHTTAPKRLGSVSRSVPRLVTRSKWSCVPATPGAGLKLSEPDMPRCIKMPPSSPASSAKGNQRYLPRRVAPPTVRPTSCSGSTPKGQRRGFPSLTAVTRAPSMRSAKLWRVVSTSGSSGMQGIITTHRGQCLWRAFFEVPCPTRIIRATGVSRMPARFNFRLRTLAIAATALVLTHGAFAQAAEPTRSRLDRQLFLQLLIGEIELREGEVGTAYEVVLDAARRTKDEQLFRRATDIALQARAGEQALAAAKIWRDEVPTSAEAHRYVIQLLVALNRPAETADVLGSLVKITPESERPSIIMNLPRFFGRVQDKKATVPLIEKVLQPYAEAPATRTAVNVAVGRAWLFAEDNTRALEFAQRAHRLDPNSEGAALFALEMLPGVPAAEELVIDHLKSKPGSDSIRQVYARILSASQRFADAAVQLEAVTARQPQMAGPYLTLGALYLELKQPKQATATLER